MQLTQSTPTFRVQPYLRPVRPLADRNRLIEDSIGLVHALAAQIARTKRFPMLREDVVSCGMRGLIQAANAFDDTRGVSFRTYAYSWIRGAMFDGMRDGHGPNTRSEWLRMKEAATSMRAAGQAAAGERSSAELPRSLRSLTVMSEDWTRALPCELEALTPEDHVSNLWMAERVRAAISELPARERQVIELLYFKHDRSFKDVAAELGVGRPHIFRIHGRAVARLRERLAEVAD